MTIDLLIMTFVISVLAEVVAYYLIKFLGK
jgi:hypothetical protein